MAGVRDYKCFRFELGEPLQNVAHAGPGDARRREEEEREGMLDHRDGPVQKIGRREPLGDHVAGLHQFQGELERVGVVQAAADDNRSLHEAVAFRARRNFGFERQCGFGPFRQAPQIVHPNPGAQRVSQQIEQQQLAAVGFRGCDAALAPGADQKHVLGQARQ